MLARHLTPGRGFLPNAPVCLECSQTERLFSSRMFFVGVFILRERDRGRIGARVRP